MKETEITRAIVESYVEKFLDCLESDVVIAGAGPAGLSAAYYLAASGLKTAVFERKRAAGGGIWGGGAGCNVVVVEDPQILDEFGVSHKSRGGLHTADAVELAGALTYKAEQAGAHVFNLVQVEDLVLKEGILEGVVINASPIVLAALHVDPVCVACRAVVDATGHPAEVLQMLKRKHKDFHVKEIGEGFMDVEAGERGVVERTGEVYRGLYVAGMSVCAAYNLPRMGPIFGGMLRSGKKVANLICVALGSKEVAP